MTDRELLERAAKAAGATWSDYSDHTPDHLVIRHADGVWREWNPLKDDGDAFRLAVKLNILDLGALLTTGAEMSADPYSAIRRAIVCAAADFK